MSAAQRYAEHYASTVEHVPLDWANDGVKRRCWAVGRYIANHVIPSLTQAPTDPENRPNQFVGEQADQKAAQS